MVSIKTIMSLQFTILPPELEVVDIRLFTKLNRKRNSSEKLRTLCNLGLYENAMHFLVICHIHRYLGI